MADLTQAQLDSALALVDAAGGWGQFTPQVAGRSVTKAKTAAIAALGNAATLTVTNWQTLRTVAQQVAGHNLPVAQLRAEAKAALLAGDAATMWPLLFLLAAGND